jgi:hypothetical protein
LGGGGYVGHWLYGYWLMAIGYFLLASG